MPLARRCRSSSATLDRPESHGGREVNGPRTQRASTLHRRHRLRSGPHHLHLPNFQQPEPPPTDSGTGRRRTATPPSYEHQEGGGEVVGFRRTPPPEKITAATNHQPDSAFLSTALPANHPLHPSYVQTGTEVSPPSRRRSGRRRGGKPAAAPADRREKSVASLSPRTCTIEGGECVCLCA